MKIIMFGSPGSGKGTQSKLLEKYLDIPHISTGTILRKTAETDKDLNDVLKTGHLLDDEKINPIVIGYLEKKQHFILDGYPRNVLQAELFKRKFGGGYLAIYLKVDEEIAVNRLENRQEGRNDDKKDIILERLGVYHEETFPVLQMLNNVITIDAEGSPEEVNLRILVGIVKKLVELVR